MVKSTFESAITRLKQFPAWRRRHEPQFLEPQPTPIQLTPPRSAPDIDLDVTQPDEQAAGKPEVCSAMRPETGGGSTSTREAIRRQEAAELFEDLHVAAETFARAHRRSLGLDQRGEHIAHLIATFSRCVFGEHWDIGMAVQDAMGIAPDAVSAEFCELVTKANVLRKLLRQSLALEVDDAARLGTHLDPDRQTPWKSSLPNAPIRFVVFPGLLSRGHVVTKQQVYTISLREARQQGCGA